MSGAATRRRTIDDSVLDDLRGRANLPAMVGRGVHLRRSGRCWTGLCPFHGERNPSFAVYANGYHCFGCGSRGDVFDWVMQEQRVPFLDAVSLLAQSVGVELPFRVRVQATRPPLESVPPTGPVESDEDRERRAKNARNIWLGGKAELTDTPVDLYLRGRGIDIARLPRAPRSLRYVPELWCKAAGRFFPAMVAAISGGDGKHIGTHRTWLDRDGGSRWRKADVEKPKMVLGSSSGGTIRLSRGISDKPLALMPADEWLAIGEGIETCLTVALACPELRVVAGVYLSGMGLAVLPEQANRIILLGENDAKRTAILQWQRVVNHHLALGREVRIARSNHGADFNDAIRP